MMEPMHYLVKGPVLSWRLACTDKTRPGLAELKRRNRGLRPTPFPPPRQHTKDADKVTCKRCLAVMAAQVGAALGGGVTDFLGKRAQKWVSTILPSPARLEAMIKAAMDELGVEYKVDPIPPPDGEGVMHAVVYYKNADGEVQRVELAVSPRP